METKKIIYNQQKRMYKKETLNPKRIHEQKRIYNPKKRIYEYIKN